MTHASNLNRFDRGAARLIDTARASGFTGKVYAFSLAERTYCDDATGRAVAFNGLGYPWDHSSRMYAWKAECIRRAWAMGHQQVMYLDAAVVVQHNPAPIAEFLKDHGYLWGHSGFKCAEWTSDLCLNRLHTSVREAAGMDMVLAGLIGFDFGHERSRNLFTEYWRAAAAPNAHEMFNGAHVNENSAVSARSDCRGHRHDQSVFSIMAARAGMGPNDPEHRYIGYQTWEGDMKKPVFCVRGIA